MFSHILNPCVASKLGKLSFLLFLNNTKLPPFPSAHVFCAYLIGPRNSNEFCAAYDYAVKEGLER